MRVKIWLLESFSKHVIYRLPNVQGQKNIAFVNGLFYFVLLGVVLAVKSPLFSQCTYRNPTCIILGMSKVWALSNVDEVLVIFQCNNFALFHSYRILRSVLLRFYVHEWAFAKFGDHTASRPELKCQQRALSIRLRNLGVNFRKFFWGEWNRIFRCNAPDRKTISCTLIRLEFFDEPSKQNTDKSILWLF